MLFHSATKSIVNLKNRVVKPPDRNAPKCCICIPMKCGIILLGVFSFFDFIAIISKTLHYFESHSVWVGVIFTIALVTELINMFFFARYFCQDNFTTRKLLTKGCKLMIFANLLCYIAMVFGVFNYKNNFMDSQIISSIP